LINSIKIVKQNWIFKMRIKLQTFLLLLSPVIFFSFSSCTVPYDDITKMSGTEMICYTTKDVKKAVITVGIVQNGEMSYVVYGENGKILSQKEHVYEIGSITKTFTASLLCKAISENKTNFDDSINVYLNLPSKNYYPTIKRLITHTSGYEPFYYEGFVSTAFYDMNNSFYGITKKFILDCVGKINLENANYPFLYSNFGIAVVGLILENIFNQNYTPLMNEYIKNELMLNNTKISDGSGNLSNYWLWNKDNPYIAAGAIISTISDMMIYAQMQMDETPSYLSLSHDVFAQINATSSNYAELGIRMDAVGAAWMIDTENNIIWHNGGTGNYNSYLGFDKTKHIAVVVLSNMAEDFKLNATVIGSALLKEFMKVK